jgi:hypothetical protein
LILLGTTATRPFLFCGRLRFASRISGGRTRSGCRLLRRGPGWRLRRSNLNICGRRLCWHWLRLGRHLRRRLLRRNRRMRHFGTGFCDEQVGDRRSNVIARTAVTIVHTIFKLRPGRSSSRRNRPAVAAPAAVFRRRVAGAKILSRRCRIIAIRAQRPLPRPPDRSARFHDPFSARFSHLWDRTVLEYEAKGELQ